MTSRLNQSNPSRGTQLDVVDLWRSLTDYIIQKQEEHHMFLNKPTVGSV